MSRIVALARSRAVGASAWSLTAVVLAAVTGIFTARALGPADRGTLALVVSIAGFCALVGALGTNVAVRRHLPRRLLVNRGAYRRVTGILAAPLSIILIAATYIVATLVDPHFGDLSIGVAFVGYGILFFFSNQALDLLNALGEARSAARVNALGSAASLALVAAVAILAPSIALVVWAYALSLVVQIVVAIRIVRRRHGVDPEAPRGVKTLLADGSRLLGLNVGQQLAYQADTILLGAFADRYQVGIYAVAITPAAILRIPATMVGQVLFHDVAAGLVDKRKVGRRIGLLLALVVPSAAVAWFIGGWLIQLLFGSQYAGAVEPFRVLLVAEVFLSPFLVLGRVLPAMGRTWGASACGIVGAASLILFSAVLIPQFGAVGSAWASVISYGVMSVFAAIMFIRTQSPEF